MADLLGRVVQFILRNWLEIVKGCVSIWVAVVATVALKTWKRQSKAQKQIEFLDEITTSVHEFIVNMSAPIEMLKYIKIEIESHAHAQNLNPDIENPEAVAYIQRNGKEDSKKLAEYLSLVGPSLTRIRSLSAKGQVMGLKDFPKCHTSCAMLTWQHDRMQSLCYIIGSPSLNWVNPEVQKTLSKVIQLHPDEIRTQLEEHNVTFLIFVKDNYEKIFK